MVTPNHLTSRLQLEHPNHMCDTTINLSVGQSVWSTSPCKAICLVTGSANRCLMSLTRPVPPQDAVLGLSVSRHFSLSVGSQTSAKIGADSRARECRETIPERGCLPPTNSPQEAEGINGSPEFLHS